MPAGPGPRCSTGLIGFDRCETCDCMTRIPASAADDRVSVFWWSWARCWWVSDPGLGLTRAPNAALSTQLDNEIC